MTSLSKIQASARGETCSLRIPGVCNWNPETTVWCHLGKGGGKRLDDHFGAYGCSSCHDVVDGRSGSPYNRGELAEFKLDAIRESQRKLKEKGLL